MPTRDDFFMGLKYRSMVDPSLLDIFEMTNRRKLGLLNPITVYTITESIYLPV